MYIPVLGIFSVVLKDQNSSLPISFGMLVIGFLFTWLTSRRYTKIKLKGACWPGRDVLGGENPIIILGTIYGIVAGLAITGALGDYVNALELSAEQLKNVLPNLDMDEQDLPIFMTLRLIGFFTIALTFYHGAAVILTTVAAELHKVRKRGKIFYNFFFLFTEGILLYFMSKSLGNIDQFVRMFLVLLIVDVVWALTHLISDKITKNPQSTTKNPQSSVEWIHLDFLMIGFLITFLVFPSLSQFSGLYINIILLVALLVRTIVDYMVGWRLVYFRGLGDKIWDQEDSPNDKGNS